jgi:RNA polymerase sigma factor (sigma-70 family)
MSRATLTAAVRHVRALAAGGGANDPTDGDLLRAFAVAGDGDAFAALVKRHGPLVLGVCRRVLHRLHDAEDAFQATFVLLAQRAVALKGYGSLAGWLHGVAYRMAKNAQRADARRRRHEGEAESATPRSPAGEAEWREVQAILDEEIQRLPATYREPFVLCCLENHSRTEAARRLGVKEGTIWSRLTGARRRLRDRLARRGVALSAVLAALALARPAAAAVPSQLAASTVSAAVGGSAAAGTISPSVAALVKGAKGIMVLTRTKAILLGVLTAGLLAGSLATATHWLARAGADEPAAERAPRDQPPAKSPGAPAGKFAEGWSQTIEDLKQAGVGKKDVVGRWKLTVEQGWLIVRRETAAGELEWQVVLARAADGPLPQAHRVDEFYGAIEVKYGNCFVRETGDSLRVLRERKTADSPPWPQPRLEPAAIGPWAGGQSPHVSGWITGDWFWAAAGLDGGRSDVLVRMQHKDIYADKGSGSSSWGDRLVKMYCGDRTLQDDGELLVADRALVEDVERALQVRKIKKEIVTQTAPAIDGQAWFNTPAELALDKLRGKVVLLDFWGAWCGPCVEKLPRSEELYQKYKDRGLVVIGVHSANDDEKLRSVLEEKKITFPVVHDRGATADRYAIEAWPTYFLIDKAGKVVWGFAHNPPEEKQIEELLR